MRNERCGNRIGIGICIFDARCLAQYRTYACMCILDVVDRIGRVLLLGLLDIEVNCLVGRAREHEKARGIGSDFVENLFKAHHLTRALGHANGLAITKEVDHLADDDLGLARMAKDVTDRLDALDVAVVVGAQDVDAAVEAAVELVLVIGDVRGEVRVAAIGLDEHAVLVVAKVRRPEPDGIIFVVEVASLAQGVERTGEARAAIIVLCVGAALGIPHVELEAKAGKELLGVVEDGLVRELLEVGGAFVRIRVDPGGPFRIVDDAGNIDDVGTGIAVLGKLGSIRFHVLDDEPAGVLHAGRRAFGDEPCNLQVANGNGFGEDVHLVARVIDVELAGHIIACE